LFSAPLVYRQQPPARALYFSLQALAFALIDRKSLAFVTNSKYRYILRHTPWRAGLRGKCCHKQQGKRQDFSQPNDTTI
jgi:hypothetical protein